MSKQFWAVIVLVILALVGIYAFGNKPATTTNSSGAKPTTHITGSSPLNVTLVEYGDYQCPFCGQYYPTLKQVTDTYKDTVKFQFRNFPITSAHPNAFAAARAAEAAGLQGKYWEMHDALYQTQTQWASSTAPSTIFEQFATQLSLNLTQFKKDFASSKVNDFINADMAEGNRLGVAGTPTFYLDGKQVQIANSLDSFKKVIDAELAKKAPKTSTNTTSTSPAAAPAATQ